MELQERTPGIRHNYSINDTGEEVQGEHSAHPNQTAPPAQASGSPTKSISLQKLGFWWSQNISLEIEDKFGSPSNDSRDYLALERNFFSWFRTSVFIISFSVVITQFFIFKQLDPTKGIVLGSLLSGGGIIVVLIGCRRYFRQQKRLVQGKILGGGWDALVIISLLISLLIVLIVVVVIEA